MSNPFLYWRAQYIARPRNRNPGFFGKHLRKKRAPTISIGEIVPQLFGLGKKPFGFGAGRFGATFAGRF